MNTLLILAIFVALAHCFTEQEYQTEFTKWMQAHQKSYTVDEFQGRYSTFKNNMDYVSQWNSVNSDTKLGMTIFADMSNAEYRKTYLGTHIVKTPSVFANEKAPSDNPSSVDWRTKGAVTAIKNQGQCGDCWAFSTTGSVEGIHAISTGNLVSLSEQNLCDCSSSYGNNGCNGGLMDYAFKYIIDNNGVDTESTYPYKGVQGKCEFDASNVGATITGYTDVSSGSESALQTAVAQQPVSVAIDASHESFQLYTSGVYYEPACSTSQLDHGVLAIGYGTSGSSDYWLVKNSWGTSWGQQGYIWMARNRNNNCGIATAASYPAANGNSSTGKTTTGKPTGHATSGKTHTTHTSTTSTSSTSSTSSTTATSYSQLGFENYRHKDGLKANTKPGKGEEAFHF
eukprot:Phypoly_transcript_10480.p1 GENE.Phypoly_transcript_10480~~Phypoly_transcript_10480.p1  ORF type:complete len:408 (+),score=79.58 Phypoly_transcript_10480:33-1226(+)